MSDLSGLQLLCISSLFTSSFLFLTGFFTGTLKKLKTYTAKDYAMTVLISLPGTFFYYLFYYTGTSFMPSSQAFIINYLWPVMCVVFACLILKEKITPVKVISLLLSFAGVIIFVGKNLLRFDPNTLIGAAFCLAGAITYGLFSALMQKSPYDKRNTQMIGFFVSFILTSIIHLISGTFPILTAKQTLGVAWNGIVSIGISSTLWQLALEAKNTAKISSLAYLTPVLSLVWTRLILGEEITVFSVLGLAVILLGILVQVKGKKDKA